jgi:rfaE bifunctional protein nucleotidyltransferase chain/domain/rfaE bifunctional protein kinase chain/domain
MSAIVVVGDALLDRDLDGSAERIAPDAPVPVISGLDPHDRPGGAGLAAALAAAAGLEVTLICALGADRAGTRVRGLVEQARVRVCDLGLPGRTPEKVRVRAAGQTLVRLDVGGEERRCGPLTAAARNALRAADCVLVSDYGRGLAADSGLRQALAAPGGPPVIWDPHPRGPDPIPGCVLVTPNAAEALTASDGAGDGHAAVETAARALRARWQAVHVCVTRGERGALLVGASGPALAIPASPVQSGDPCGAGDCFAVTAAGRLAAGSLPSEAARAAVAAASAFVAAGGAAHWSSAAATGPPAPEDGFAVAARVRARGGTVVATGGCFDLLHAGHVRALEAARALGDCLIVCLNSDASVRRLKGPDRPLTGEHDRAAVLAALRPVDAVIVFDEDDPRAVLRRLRPHVWAKGGDYAATELPEAETVADWGGHAVAVPYVAGHSTTRLIEEAIARAG